MKHLKGDESHKKGSFNVCYILEKNSEKQAGLVNRQKKTIIFANQNVSGVFVNL